MADALVSPAVGSLFWAASGGSIVFCARTLTKSLREDLVPTMGVLGAFVFAVQMINFAIPGTGSSGHLGGGLLLAVLLGPHAAMLVMASVLTIQAFFFADGGLLALGCNITNLGLIPAFIAYPLIYRPLAGRRPTSRRGTMAMVVAAAIGLQLGAMAVVLQTWASGISALPLGPFLFMMLPIHLAIGVVEGLATATVVSFVARARPAALSATPASHEVMAPGGIRPVLLAILAAAVVTGGVISWYASTQPDGLEWAIHQVVGPEHSMEAPSSVHRSLSALQDQTAILPGYAIPEMPVSAGASPPASGIVGGAGMVVLICLAGVLFRSRSASALRSRG